MVNKMYSNFFISQEPIKEIEANYYIPDQEIDPKEFYRIIKGLENRFFRRGFLTCTWGNKVIVVDDGELNHTEIIGNKFSFSLSSEKIKLTPQENKFQIASLVDSALKHIALSRGYTGPESQKFFKINPYKKDFFLYHDAFFSSVEVLEDGRVGIWIDPTTRWKQSVNDFIEWCQTNNKFTREYVREYLIGKTVMCPSVNSGRYFRAEIVDVNFRPINKFEIILNGTKMSVYDYWTKHSDEHKKWLRRNNIALNPEEFPTITVQIPNMSIRPSFPPSLLQVIINIDDPLLPDGVLEEKKILNPRGRIRKTFDLFDELLSEGLVIWDNSLNFTKELIEWTKPENRKYGRILPLKSPSLLFGNKKVGKADSPWRDPNIKFLLSKYGPVTKKEKVKIIYILPDELVNRLDEFNKRLNKISKTLNLCDFILDKYEVVDRYHPDRYLRVCKKLGNELEKEDVIVVVVLPPENITKAYYSAKRGLGLYQVKSQMIRYQIFNSCLKMSKTSILDNLAVQIYDKSLKSGESIWHLSKPAGGVDPNKIIYFMGFDISRSPEKRKEAAAYAAICDSYGRILYRKAIDSHKGEKIQAKVLSDWFFDVASSTFDETKQTKKIDELILFKDGPIPSNQLIDYRNGSIDAKERLIEERIMDKSSNIRIVSVVKRGPYRIYGKEEYDYKTQNTGLIRNDKEALIVTTPGFQGTPSTLKLRIEFQIKEDMNIEELLKIFNDLRYLDWSSLYKQPKTILPLHIVQNLAKLSKEDVDVPYVPR